MTSTHHFDFPLAITDDARAFITAAIEESFSTVSLEIDEQRISVAFNEEVVDAEFEQLLRKLLFVVRNMSKDCIFTHSANNNTVQDVYPQLLEKGDVQKVDTGLFMFQGEFLQVFHAINAKVKQLSTQFQAIEQEYPALWPIELFKKINYLEEFPQQAILCAGVKPTKKAKDNVAASYSKIKEFSEIEIDDNFAPAKFGLQPAVCDCCYYMLRDKDQIENTSYTCYNKVFRNETSATGGLERLTNFSVRDVMFVGGASYVLERRQRVFEMLEVFVQELQLNCKLESANDPFFAGNAISKSVFQYASQLKHELLFDVPGLPKAMAFGSVNLHLDFFGSAFDIQLKDGEAAHSACVGIGMERMSYALFCQHGAQLSEWPESVKEYLELS